MSEDQIYMSEQEKIPQLFEGIRDIKEKNNGYFLSLQPWDIQIFLNKSHREPNTPKEEKNKQSRAWVLWEHCFMRKNIHGDEEEEKYEIIRATQSDLVWILEWLKKLLWNTEVEFIA